MRKCKQMVIKIKLQKKLYSSEMTRIDWLNSIWMAILQEWCLSSSQSCLIHEPHYLLLLPVHTRPSWMPAHSRFGGRYYRSEGGSCPIVLLHPRTPLSTAASSPYATFYEGKTSTQDDRALPFFLSKFLLLPDGTVAVESFSSSHRVMGMLCN